MQYRTDGRVHELQIEIESLTARARKLQIEVESRTGMSLLGGSQAATATLYCAAGSAAALLAIGVMVMISLSVPLPFGIIGALFLGPTVILLVYLIVCYVTTGPDKNPSSGARFRKRLVVVSGIVFLCSLYCFGFLRLADVRSVSFWFPIWIVEAALFLLSGSLFAAGYPYGFVWRLRRDYVKVRRQLDERQIEVRNLTHKSKHL